MSGSNKKGKKYSNKEFKRVTIWCKPSEWERLNYLSASSGKSLSTWAVEKALLDKPCSFEMQSTEFPNSEEIGCVKPLCVETEKWDIIKKRAEAKGMTISKYFLSVVLE